MDWGRDGAGWPNREHSRFVESRPHRWHVQIMGEGETILLLHGTGGATHSWRDLMPELAAHHHVVAPDLPGHGFTRLETRRRSSLAAMAEDTWHLCDTLGATPTAIVGHSAGAAIALAMAGMRDGVRHVVGLNAALGQFDGPAAWLFPVMARTLAATPFVPLAVAGVMSATGGTGRVLASTGSRIDPVGEALYRRLVATPSHVEGALEMMAQWSTRRVTEALPDLPCRVTLMVGSQDGTVPPAISRDLATRAENTALVDLGAYGHLVHEEIPTATAAAIRRAITAR